MAARQRGAKALLVVTGPRSPNAGQTVPMTFDTALAGSGIPAASISGKAAAALFGSRSLESVQKELDTGNPHVAGFALDGVTVELSTKLVREKRTARNVVAYLPATSPVTGVEKPWIVVGAHYDHLGLGRNGNSLASGADAGKPHVGADDNASGSAAVLAVAEAFARRPVRRRNLVVALWSAEEIGLIGSNSVRECATDSTESGRRVLQLRHGRPDAGQQARRAGDRQQHHVGIAHRTRERRRGFRPDICSRIRISRRTSRRSTRPRCRA